MTRAQHAIARARAAVLARAGVTPCPDRVGGVPQHQEHDICNTVALVNPRHSHNVCTFREFPDNFSEDAENPPYPDPAVTFRPDSLVEPSVRLPAQSDPEPKREASSRPSYAPLELLVNVGALKAGPFRLLELLWEIAKHTAGARAYPLMPSQVTVHLPQELVARALGCHVVTVWRWLAPLKALRLIDARAHYSTSQGVTRADGTLFAVCLQPGHWAGLTFDDLSHEWRDLDADREAGRTAWAALKARKGQAPSQGVGWVDMLKSWAVSPGDTGNPVVDDPCSLDADDLDVQAVVYKLGELPAVHPRHRAGEVGKMGAALARALDDRHSRRWYCGLIWRAWEGYMRGEGTLQVLAAQLARLNADRREWAGLRRAPALLASRLAST